MIRLAMFDMDGVLFDSMPRHIAAWEKVFGSRGITIAPEDIYANEGRSSQSIIDIVVRKYLGHPADEEQLSVMYAEKNGHVARMGNMPCMPGTADVLSAAKSRGLDCIVVTGSGNEALLSYICQVYPEFFTRDKIVSASDCKRCKPAPEPYQKGMRIAGITDPSEALVVENAPLGIQSGKAAGCTVAAVNTGPLPDSLLWDCGADYVFHSMAELAAGLDTVLKGDTESSSV